MLSPINCFTSNHFLLYLFEWQHNVVFSAFASINVVYQHRALGQVTACGQVNHLGM